MSVFSFPCNSDSRNIWQPGAAPRPLGLSACRFLLASAARSGFWRQSPSCPSFSPSGNSRRVAVDGDSMVKIAQIAGLGNYLLMFGRRALCPQTSLSIAGFPGIPGLRVVEVQRHKRFLRREEMPR